MYKKDKMKSYNKSQKEVDDNVLKILMEGLKFIK